MEYLAICPKNSFTCISFRKRVELFAELSQWLKVGHEFDFDRRATLGPIVILHWASQLYPAAYGADGPNWIDAQPQQGLFELTSICV